MILVLVHAVSKAHVAKMDKRSNKQKLKSFQNGENLEFEFSSHFQFKLGRAQMRPVEDARKRDALATLMKMV